MNKKQLLKTAILSSPIMAALELSLFFFLLNLNKLTLPFNFFTGILTISLLIFSIWIINIYLITFIETKKNINKWERYTLSYLFSILIFALFLIFVILFPYHKSQDIKPSAFFSLLNIITLNTIILTIINNIEGNTKRIKAERELAELKIKKLEAEQQQLIQQLQPHFLFNSLSTLNSIIGTDDNLAKKYLVKLSNFLRFTISAHDNAIIPLTEELIFTKDYIELQQTRFGNSFFCTVSIPEEIISQYNIPVYALQSLVENAIKHNSFNEIRPLIVNIIFKDESIIVTNNKTPKTVSLEVTREGVGLKNLKKRYLLSADKEVIINDSDNEFMVVLKLIRKDYDKDSDN